MPMDRKYIIVVGDGMADYPIETLGGKTPLMAAKTPHMDWMVQHGEMGLVKTVPNGFIPGSEIANLSIFGYDPHLYFTGRGPIEAASMGVELTPGDIAYRCNLVTVNSIENKMVMEDFSAGHISDEEARGLIQFLNRELASEVIQFYPGVSYRHLMVLKNGVSYFSDLEKMRLIPPHDIVGQQISPFLKQMDEPILSLTKHSHRLLNQHPINLAREMRGHPKANSIWLWGQGRSPQMPSLRERFGIEGFVISAVHLVKGIGILAGMEVLDVPGITGYFDTNYEGKAQYALRGLKERDFVFVHIEAPDEAGHMGDLRLKIAAIEAFDEKVVGNILKGMKGMDAYKILVLPDHPTPLSVRTHTADPVPYVIYSNEQSCHCSSSQTFDEISASLSGNSIERGFELIERFLGP